MKRSQVNVRLSPEAVARLKAEAAAKNLTVSALLRAVLHVWWWDEDKDIAEAAGRD